MSRGWIERERFVSMCCMMIAAYGRGPNEILYIVSQLPLVTCHTYNNVVAWRGVSRSVFQVTYLRAFWYLSLKLFSFKWSHLQTWTVQWHNRPFHITLEHITGENWRLSNVWIKETWTVSFIEWSDQSVKRLSHDRWVDVSRMWFYLITECDLKGKLILTQHNKGNACQR